MLGLANAPERGRIGFPHFPRMAKWKKLFGAALWISALAAALAFMGVDTAVHTRTTRELTNSLKRLQPRLYSISSSPKAHAGQVHLTVGAVRYEKDGRPRKGVCSTFLADRAQPGTTRIGVALEHRHRRFVVEPRRLHHFGEAGAALFERQGAEHVHVGDDEIATLLEAASQEGGTMAFPSLYALLDPTRIDDPGELMDELVRLAATEAGREHPVLIGTLRDDLMQALAAAGEG